MKTKWLTSKEGLVMFQMAVSEEDKRLVGSLTKKKRQRGQMSMKARKVNVYFNKSNNKQGTYYTGKFKSVKNNAEFTYRSSYELKFFQMLEEDTNIVNYLSESFSVPYINSECKQKVYIPDILALTASGDFIVYEIKPKEMLKDLDVQRKAQACKVYIKNVFGKTAKYQFITETHLFETPKAYTDFLKEVKKCQKT